MTTLTHVVFLWTSTSADSVQKSSISSVRPLQTALTGEVNDINSVQLFCFEFGTAVGILRRELDCYRASRQKKLSNRTGFQDNCNAALPGTFASHSNFKDWRSLPCHVVEPKPDCPAQTNVSGKALARPSCLLHGTGLWRRMTDAVTQQVIPSRETGRAPGVHPECARCCSRL